MSSHTINFTLPQSDRINMRKNLIEKMLKEEPGAGKGDYCSRYEYIVEKYQTYEIFLKRPTQLNKGFDFTVNIRGLWFKKQRRYSNPSHGDIFDILLDCKTNYPDQYNSIEVNINNIFNCKAVDFSTPLNIFFKDYDGNQHPIEIILLSIKWLFMEQDCAYWNYSGRQMLYDGLKDRNLVR